VKRLPHSLSAQLLAQLVLALLAAHALAVVVMSWGEGVRVHPLAVRAVTAQVAAAYRLTCTDASTSLLKALDAPDAHFTRAAHAPDAVLHAQQESALVQAIRQGLHLPDATPVYAVLHELRADATDHASVAPAGLLQTQHAAAAWRLDIALPLPDGQWLHSQHQPAMMHPHWDRVLRFSLAVSVLASMLIAILFGRSIMRPLQALAHAARRISRGEAMAPLPLQGPRGVRAITRAFNDMQERLGRFVSDRTQMIAAIGHDLRTPLTSLRIRTELIEDEALRTSMRATLDEMAAMTQESLHFAQDDAVQEPTQRVEMTALITEVVAHQRVLGRDVAWDAPAAIAYRCRALHVKRVLNNLLDNATRYGHARIALSAQDAELRITIDDDGPGIAPDQLERVFEPFARLDAARNLESSSVGLGLAIARSFARAHGGDVQLCNRAEGGLRAVVTLPL